MYVCAHQVWPGSARPLRARLNPTSIRFWKALDKAGVDVSRHSRRAGLLESGDPAALFT